MNQLDKNTVKADRQLLPSQYVSFPTALRDGLRVLFVGNSITRHGIRPEIGWTRDCGMAASEWSKDYVHLVMQTLADARIPACGCIAQVAQWERHYADGRTFLNLFQTARLFHPDIIVWRAIENCPGAKFDATAFTDNCRALVDWLNEDGHARCIWTTSFWKHPGDPAIRALAESRREPLIELGDLGELDEMKAIGLFAHSGVANHPGDRGMLEIAHRICAVLLPMIQ